MKEQKMRKLHNPETGRHWYMRIVSLLLVAVLLWIGLENTILQVQAGQEKGPIILNGDVPDVDFWYGTANNNKPCRIRNINMQMTQNVTGANVQIQSSRQNVETKLSGGTVTAKYLDEDRYEHTLGVMFTCAALAMVHDCDLITAQTAGLLHDCAKCIPNKKKLKMCILPSPGILPESRR